MRILSYFVKQKHYYSMSLTILHFSSQIRTISWSSFRTPRTEKEGTAAWLVTLFDSSFIFKQPNIFLCLAKSEPIYQKLFVHLLYQEVTAGFEGWWNWILRHSMTRWVNHTAVNHSADKFLFPCFSIPVWSPLCAYCMLRHCVYFVGILAHGEECIPAKIPLAEEGSLKTGAVHACLRRAQYTRERDHNTS